MTPSAAIWRDVFVNWPASIPRRGILISTLNEPTPFKGFLHNDNVLLLERANPDPAGTRFVLFSYDGIHSIKFTDQLKESVLTSAGYVGKLSGT
jgi:hypothetical protein